MVDFAHASIPGNLSVPRASGGSSRDYCARNGNAFDSAISGSPHSQPGHTLNAESLGPGFASLVAPVSVHSPPATSGSPNVSIQQMDDGVPQATSRRILRGPGCTFDPRSAPEEKLPAIR